MNILPIINENDSVATEEIGFGDNDQLSAQIAQSIEADLLILLSDVSGLYDKNPQTNQNAKLITNINKITKSTHQMASTSTSHYGTGGMESKLKAAEIAIKGGADVIISSGKISKSLTHLQKTNEFSFFKAAKTAISARKKWISNLKAKGKLTIDKGANDALKKNKSLLPVGITKVTGDFEKGDIIEIIHNNKKVTQGITNFNSTDLKKIKGQTTAKIKQTLKTPTKTTAIHKDDMA